MDDSHWMRQALELARRGEGAVEPNPMVGAVVVRDGQRVGAGWHERFGGPHAEVNALAAAGPAARGADLYVTLEPCRHWGKTPPCVGAILQAGVRRVLAAVTDPHPEMAGRGLAELRAAGLEVVVGLEEAAARHLLAPYLRLVQQGRPWVLAKWAMSLDGKIATASGQSRWLTGAAARERVHALRGRVDGILVGIGTALADDPLLTARPPGPRTPTRVVLDRRLRLPLTSQLVRTARQTPLLIIHHPEADPARRAALEAAGAECLALPPGADEVPSLLAELGRRRWTNLLVEGGSGVLGSFLAAERIDEVWAFIAPVLLGGAAAPSPLGGPGRPALAQAPRLQWEEVQRLGDDWLCRGRVTGPDV
jgi:diaminohydroxyphosphoribosylaminopyrimidine deaminase/5-amino-6-(5-phosphoribosylamino)uracil reductase